MSAGRELLSRYRKVWRGAWQQRKSMDAPKRLGHEVTFLPAALALRDAPVHPAPRVVQWLIIAFAVLALIWACLGEIDVVATATGKVVPSGKSKIVQSSEVAVVKAIHVQDGQKVEVGDLLVELDAQITGADVQRLQSDLVAAQVDSARAAALLEAMNAERAPAALSSRLTNLSYQQQVAAEAWLQGQYAELQSSLAQSDAEIAQRNAEMAAAREGIIRLEESIPITRELSADYKRLLEKGYIAKHAYLEREQLRLQQERELALQKAHVLELQAAKQQAQSRRQSVLDQTSRAMLDLLNASEQRAAGLEQELNKAEQRNRLMLLKAPVSGTVQQLAIHTAGGVVTEAQPLMVIVPSNQPVEVEVMVQNKDIGFVRAGQSVEIKVDAFSFTKYGVIDGVVASISDDAIEDDKFGLVYSAKISIADAGLFVGNRRAYISPGMSVQAEVKTDKRKVVDYFLSPLKVYTHESLTER
ncbi:hemolysin D [Halopseudomonas sabulinigri]|uniref:Membrane fusion protein (MFP) family protein n=1 Tax=Halopseudomonas sabulinigri TaxID=472181 RepID=A0A1H1LJV3_9GAMM|nr:HlyD family type I secretion periplasmic adaptor subunit [Halopseudomonas sabulinigri]SDR74788.1 hemolysin D [Halopseudomonas sabulinigri]